MAEGVAACVQQTKLCEHSFLQVTLKVFKDNVGVDMADTVDLVHCALALPGLDCPLGPLPNCRHCITQKSGINSVTSAAGLDRELLD